MVKIYLPFFDGVSISTVCKEANLQIRSNLQVRTVDQMGYGPDVGCLIDVDLKEFIWIYRNLLCVFGGLYQDPVDQPGCGHKICLRGFEKN